MIYPYLHTISLPELRWQGTNIFLHLDPFAFISVPTSLPASVLFLLIFMFLGNKCLSSAQSGSRMHSFPVPPDIFHRLSLPFSIFVSTYMNLACKIFTFHTGAIFHKLKTNTSRDKGICHLTNILISPIQRCYVPVPWDFPWKDRMTTSYVSLLFITPYLYARTSTILWNIWIMIWPRS
jgi:hypothetical protein